MRSLLALTILASTAACGPAQSAKSLPSDLPPPEYEKPRGYDLDSGKSAPKKAPDAAPSAAPAAPAAPPPAAPKP
ncbi:Hypothetical protein A7982_03213 [Minicystis rosea]|nr:Hypothetical protein A7982_03213 [Minicystis rosea]